MNLECICSPQHHDGSHHTWCPLYPQWAEAAMDDYQAQIAALTAERDTLLARERGYLSELADYGRTVERLREQVTRQQADSTAELLKHREQVATLKRELSHAQRNNRQRNLELDALYYVWCDGGCPDGVSRWMSGLRGKLTEEIVALAERNTRRLRAWWEHHQRRAKQEARDGE